MRLFLLCLILTPLTLLAMDHDHYALIKGIQRPQLIEVPNQEASGDLFQLPTELQMRISQHASIPLQAFIPNAKMKVYEDIMQSPWLISSIQFVSDRFIVALTDHALYLYDLYEKKILPKSFPPDISILGTASLGLYDQHTIYFPAIQFIDQNQRVNILVLFHLPSGDISYIDTVQTRDVEAVLAHPPYIITCTNDSGILHAYNRQTLTYTPGLVLAENIVSFHKDDSSDAVVIGACDGYFMTSIQELCTQNAFLINPITHKFDLTRSIGLRNIAFIRGTLLMQDTNRRDLVLKTKEGETLKRIPAHATDIVSLVYDSALRIYISISEDECILWDADLFEPVARIKSQGTQKFFKVAVSPDYTSLAIVVVEDVPGQDVEEDRLPIEQYRLQLYPIPDIVRLYKDKEVKHTFLRRNLLLKQLALISFLYSLEQTGLRIWHVLPEIFPSDWTDEETVQMKKLKDGIKKIIMSFNDAEKPQLRTYLNLRYFPTA